ncbi:hypothetical protein I7I48_03368 [Histoplasma ohiense]|nr:hypothetical protein I7I48_03368 [Histoplasma ohiense (nom. inval.)]
MAVSNAAACNNKNDDHGATEWIGRPKKCACNRGSWQDRTRLAAMKHIGNHEADERRMDPDRESAEVCMPSSRRCRQGQGSAWAHPKQRIRCGEPRNFSAAAISKTPWIFEFAVE